MGVITTEFPFVLKFPAELQVYDDAPLTLRLADEPAQTEALDAVSEIELTTVICLQ